MIKKQIDSKEYIKMQKEVIQREKDENYYLKKEILELKREMHHLTGKIKRRNVIIRNLEKKLEEALVWKEEVKNEK